VRRLGGGAFGEVWESRIQPNNQSVAIKILLDADGDVIDPKADEDFRKECAALQRIDSLYLIKFYGVGTTEGDNGFIVTELLGGGSLEDVLHDRKYDLTWRLRVKFGMHVALGMEHLHKLHMLHRDLKSANVLLNEQRTKAKVCDFGLSRVSKPASSSARRALAVYRRHAPPAPSSRVQQRRAVSSVLVAYRCELRGRARNNDQDRRDPAVDGTRGVSRGPELHQGSRRVQFWDGAVGAGHA
jgi:serine/threonine protein kinase